MVLGNSTILVPNFAGWEATAKKTPSHRARSKPTHPTELEGRLEGFPSRRPRCPADAGAEQLGLGERRVVARFPPGAPAATGGGRVAGLRGLI